MTILNSSYFLIMEDEGPWQMVCGFSAVLCRELPIPARQVFYITISSSVTELHFNEELFIFTICWLISFIHRQISRYRTVVCMSARVLLKACCAGCTVNSDGNIDFVFRHYQSFVHKYQDLVWIDMWFFRDSVVTCLALYSCTVFSSLLT